MIAPFPPCIFNKNSKHRCQTKMKSTINQASSKDAYINKSQILKKLSNKS